MPMEAGRDTGEGGALAAPAVLVVDDDDEMRMLMGEILADAGYDVLEARDGNEAVLAADWHPGPIALVVTDVVMPHLDGSELGERLRVLRAGTPVLYVSGSPDVGGRVPRSAFLAKPFTGAALLDKVRELLGGPAPA